jgi:hypothetical protein
LTKNTHQSEELSELLQHRLRGRSQPAEQPAAGATTSFHIPAAAAPTASLHLQPPTYLSRPTTPKEESARRRQATPRTGTPQDATATAAMATTPGNSHKSVVSAQNSDEREHGPGRPKRRKLRRRSPASSAAGDTRPHPIYTPDAQIRGSPTLPPPERTEKGRGTRGGAGGNGRKTKTPSQSPL